MSPETEQNLERFSAEINRTLAQALAGSRNTHKGVIRTRLAGRYDAKIVGLYNLRRMNVPEGGALHRAICKDMPFAVYPESNDHVRLEFTPAPLPVKRCH